jgi:hypothetical protein
LANDRRSDARSFIDWSLSLLEIDQAFEAIASHQGPGSLERKTGMLRRLFERTN